MSHKEYKRLKQSREQQLIELGRKLERQERKRFEKRVKDRDIARRKRAFREHEKLVKRLFKGTLKQQVARMHREMSLQEFVKMAAQAGVRTRQAYSIWFSPEGAGAGIF